MSRYSIGKPEPKKPTTSAGNWSNEPVVLSLQTSLKIVVKPPAKFISPGEDIENDGFEELLRHDVAHALLGLKSDGFTVVGAVVEQFEDAGG